MRDIQTDTPALYFQNKEIRLTIQILSLPPQERPNG